MPAEAPADQLASRRHVTLIVRFLVERDGTLVFGEVVDLDSQSKGRFTTWQNLVNVLTTALAPPG